ncbi:MAG: histidine--tRNA ligase [Verrucomicrobia bacterium Tous-C9LFEB]|nr:MAG: histidine--tRNA ligase [Verrucomicrobia bacterium Tous-C9LFEB]
MPSLPGFRDFYPADCALRNTVFAAWRSTAQRYGFVEYDGPPLEELELYTKKSGEEIVGQLYHFVDKGERAVAMRSEMTPTLARMVAAQHRDYKKPIKWFSIPQVFRYERMQRGRLREHYQFNCDLIGEASLEADVELIALCIDTLRAFGLNEKDFVIRLSDRQFWVDFLKSKQVPEDKWYDVFQAIDKSERQPREKTAELLGALAEEVLNILEHGAASERLDVVENGLKARGLGEYVKRDFTVVRGLAYYTGVVFEAFDRSGEFRAIAGGGRYDNLLNNLGGVDLPALGFGMGDVVLTELLKQKGLLKPSTASIQAFVVIPDEAFRAEAAGVLQTLRDAGIAADMPLSPAKMGKQFQSAEERGAKHAVVVDAEIKNGKVAVKTLADRKQDVVELANLVSVLKS